MVLLLVSLAVSSHAGQRYYSSPVKSYAPPPPPPVIVRHVAPAPVVQAIPAVRTVEILPAPVAPVAPIVPVAPLAASSQFHQQTELGEASFGYSHPGQAAINHRDANGNMFGSWAYINPEGKEVRVSYVADALGFRVISNDLPVAPVAPVPAAVIPAPAPVAIPAAPLPVELAPAPLPVALPAPVLDTPDVAEAKRAHFAAVAEAKARNGVLSRARRGAGYGPAKSYSKSYKPVHVPVPIPAPAPAPIVFRHDFVAPAPVPVAVAPVVHALPAAPAVETISVLPHALPAVHALPAIHAAPVPTVLAAPAAVTKFHSQDELGQAAFGFTTPDQSSSNFRDIHGNQVGHYSYINPEGQEIVVHYSAGKDGFRVLSNALPVAPAAVVLQDAPDVVEARNQHFALFNEALARTQQL